MNLLSIIIPVYNVEKYLKQCVNSILEQKFSDFEIILVDDGSTDGSGKICDDFAAYDKRVKALHKQNSGPSDARNYGVDKAEGDYLLFIDSDDYYDDNEFLSKISMIISSTPDVDIINFSWKTYNELTKQYEKQAVNADAEKLNAMTDCYEQFSYLISTDSLLGSACSKAVSREFIEKNRISFEKGITCEDIDWSMKAYYCAPKMHFLDGEPYVYRVNRKNSSTATIGIKSVKDLLNIITEHIKMINSSDNKKLSVLLNYLAYQYAILCGLTVFIPKQEQKEIMPRVYELKKLLDYDLSPKVKKVNLVYKLMGIRTTVKTLQLFIKLR